MRRRHGTSLLTQQAAATFRNSDLPGKATRKIGCKWAGSLAAGLAGDASLPWSDCVVGVVGSLGRVYTRNLFSPATCNYKKMVDKPPFNECSGYGHLCLPRGPRSRCCTCRRVGQPLPLTELSQYTCESDLLQS